MFLEGVHPLEKIIHPLEIDSFDGVGRRHYTTTSTQGKEEKGRERKGRDGKGRKEGKGTEGKGREGKEGKEGKAPRDPDGNICCVVKACLLQC